MKSPWSLGRGRCFAGGVKKRIKQKKGGGIRASVDVSALYPSDSVNDTPRRKRQPAAKGDGPGNHGEKEAVREAIEGWRWL